MVLTYRTRTDILPSREVIYDLFKQGDLVPVYRTLLADLETPVSVYMKLTQDGHPAFLLESVEGGERVGRYSFIGVNPRGILSFKDNIVTKTEDGVINTRPLAEGEDPLHVIKDALAQYQAVVMDGLPRLVGGAVGYISYDVVRYFERLPKTATDELDVPDAAFMLPDTIVIFDHAKHQLIVLANARYAGNADSAYDDAVRRIDQIVVTLGKPLPQLAITEEPLSDELVSNVEQAIYEENVRRAKEYIKEGDAFQIVVSQRFSRRTNASPLMIYRALRALNPSPYMFLLQFSPDLTLVGASPEMMVRYEDGIASNRPIAGTRHRGANDAEDAALAEELLADPKERAEHVMLVDLGRNDLGRVCEYGSVKVTDMMVIERYSHVMHIVSHVEGKLRDDMDAFDLVRATFPAGTLSGAPKVRAMEIIEELEGVKRGPYGGAVGYFSFDGSMDMCITIRAILLNGDQAYIQAGAGIVADSDPATEHQECRNKAQAAVAAIDYAENGLV
ncbi:anthranilate synthase component I [Phototrophicus methaneseepsis]|uniref:Anthranilate synthase component 1 n=1 Tax=Phototrophicus methaneseepsis TaxID=2710758 RepID=A0A7S8E5J0_9CHLR|nr:anthranilate synthase component I [Phototrophicus methaneseepsis]QPC80766.1 anthranilate synthase component I [Phototrophicus methaneseepsis]